MSETSGQPDEADRRAESWGRLEPIERSSEIMFGLIMALTFTCTISVVSSTRNDVMTMLVSALGCNIAWGFVDAAMYLLSQIVERERKRSLTLKIAAASPQDARRLLLKNMPDGIDKVFSRSELDRLADGIKHRPIEPRRAAPSRDDLRGAVSIFLLVFLSTVPVALPFLFKQTYPWRCARPMPSPSRCCSSSERGSAAI